MMIWKTYVVLKALYTLKLDIHLKQNLKKHYYAKINISCYLIESKNYPLKQFLMRKKIISALEFNFLARTEISLKFQSKITLNYGTQPSTYFSTFYSKKRDLIMNQLIHFTPSHNISINISSLVKSNVICNPQSPWVIILSAAGYIRHCLSKGGSLKTRNLCGIYLHNFGLIRINKFLKRLNRRNKFCRNFLSCKNFFF